MTALQKVNLGTAPAGTDGDPVRAAFAKVNSNIDVLGAQAALTSATQITAAQGLTVNHIGKRVHINLANAGTINLPALSAVTDQDDVLLLRNLGSTVVTLAAAAGTNDWVGLSKLNPGESALMDAFGGAWNVLMRGRSRLDNEIVNGTLTIGGGIAGNLPVSGKLNAVNGTNLLLNGSGEFGLIGGWQSGFLGAVSSGTAEGTYLSNTAALTAASYAGSNPIPMAGGVVLTVSGEIYAGGVGSGSAWFRIVFLNSSGGVITVSPGVAATPGAGWTFGSYTATTPTGTASVYVQLGVEAGANGVTVAAGGVAWRRMKLEKNSAPSLYSQEASVAYLQGAPAFSGRPTFAGNTPWDSGNIPGSSSGGVFKFTNRPNFGAATPWDSANLPRANYVGTNGANVLSIWWDPANTGVRFGIDSTINSLVMGVSNTFHLTWANSAVGLYVDSTSLGNITTSSDYRAKKNVKNLKIRASDTVKALRPVSYEWRKFSIFRPDGKRHLGFIAHELQEVIPSAVCGEKDAVDENGKPQIQSLNWAPIVAVLTSALQEAFARIEALEARA
ncbi:hypothetical protein F4827_005078 [Paraburkholderia bannensis]|uniref:Peptidase S74 domain-containing protein n=1 Tax=Paraburkholderia bannensis TaxID=765414 RepID=A0A7W9U197_9BURK|nr:MULTISPECIES: tail fiber domain-containing protein [Paraburkholderia]MBB3260006.1 hypothetical protein [Paraburkholderia sp. WP4_3_2]MBB6105212.1 hypothetical protein [Paraburkholderia bannensis]